MAKDGQRRNYVVLLPEGFSNVPRIGFSTASSPAQAVTQYFHSQNPRSAKLLLYQLSPRKGYAQFAVELPIVTSQDGSPLESHVAEIMTDAALAEILAKRKNSSDPSRFLPLAREILEKREQDIRKYRLSA